MNRYTQPVVAQYSPFSMEELAFAPSFLRQRHDETNAAIQALNEQAGQYNVHRDFDNIAGQLVDPITQELTGLSGDLSQKGINESRGVDRLMQLNAKQKELFSPRGAIGQLQGRTQQFQEAQKELSEFFKDNPELAKFKLSQANIGQASINPETGKLELGDMQIPNYVRHIADKDIMKQLNDVAKGLKASDFGDLGLQGIQNVGSFQDILTFADAKGVDSTRLVNAMLSQIGPEITNSITQYGEMYGFTPEESKKAFLERVASLGQSSAYREVDRQRMRVDNEMELYKAKKALDKEETRLSSWDYDPTTQEIQPAGLDNSYFKENPTISTEEFYKDDPYNVFYKQYYPQGINVGDKNTNNYRPFSPEQQIEIAEILSSLSNKPITEEYLNTKEARDLLKDYYKENTGKVKLQPVIDNTNYLREYGGDPNKATQDIYDNYQSRILFDVQEGKQLTPQEFEKYLANGKLVVRGAYSAENPFSGMGENINHIHFSNPLSVNLKDDTGKVVKTFAISRSPSYLESKQGKESVQYNEIYNSTVRTPNIDKVHSFTFISPQTGQPIINPETGQPIDDTLMKVKYDSNSKTWKVSSIDNSFNSFSVGKTTDIADAILANKK